MNKEEKIITISQLLLKEPFIEIAKLKTKFDLSDKELLDILDQIKKRSNQVGLNFEVMELQGVDFAFFSLISTESPLSHVELSLLTIFALVTRNKIGLIQNEEMAHIFNKNIDIIFSLLDKNYLMRSEDNWNISPLGASLVLPLLSDIQPFIEKMIKNKSV